MAQTALDCQFVFTRDDAIVFRVCRKSQSPCYNEKVNINQCESCPFNVDRVKLLPSIEDLRPPKDRIVKTPTQPEPPKAATKTTRKPTTKPTTRAREPSKTTKPVPTMPPLTKRFTTWAEAVADWIAAGRPERADNEVKEIFRIHCSRCSWYDKGICKGCGCKVTEKGHAVLNKIKMGTQHCPRRKW